jgi:3-phenylpropionate/trans-cinnamate dioxygenase ferredoxin subunit
MALVRLCGIDDVPAGHARRFAAGEGQVALVNLGGGSFRAVEAVCSHEHAWLDEGEVDVDGCSLECPRHGSVFDLDTGRPRTLPATRPVAVYDVKIDDDDILIEV